MTRLFWYALAVLLAAPGCSTAKICAPGRDHSEPLVPAAYRAGDPAGGFGPIVGFSDYAVSSWNGSADPETCGLPNATIDDQVLGIHLDGIIYLEGTASWSNGLTGYEVPVFVGGGSFYVPETESFVTESVVSVSFKGYP